MRAMSKMLFVASLIIVTLIPAYDDVASDLIGAWKCPKDLMVNICEVPDSRISVCDCGIFRTFGWVDVAVAIKGDSLIIKANDVDSPFEGRLRIESADRLSGTLTMGYPGEEWYFSGSTEFIKQKPIMPENLNHQLEDIIDSSDYGVLANCRDIVWDALSTISPKAYGYSEKGDVEKLLNAKVYPVIPEDMIGFKRVRSIQIDAHDGIFSYPYFRCRFNKSGGRVFFEKTTGSQRKSGYIYQNSPESLIFLGGWSVNDDPQTAYGSSNSVVGTVYKIGPSRAIMIFPTDDDRVEIYELTK